MGFTVYLKFNLYFSIAYVEVEKIIISNRKIFERESELRKKIFFNSNKKIEI